MPVSSGSGESQGLNFFSLPPELRNMIYAYYLDTTFEERTPRIVLSKNGISTATTALENASLRLRSEFLLWVRSKTMLDVILRSDEPSNRREDLRRCRRFFTAFRSYNLQSVSHITILCPAQVSDPPHQCAHAMEFAIEIQDCIAKIIVTGCRSPGLCKYSTGTWGVAAQEWGTRYIYSRIPSLSSTEDYLELLKIVRFLQVELWHYDEELDRPITTIDYMKRHPRRTAINVILLMVSAALTSLIVWKLETTDPRWTYPNGHN